MKEIPKREAKFWESILAILQMAVIVAIGYIYFHIRIEILMILSAIVAGVLAKKIGYTYMELEGAICEKIMRATPAILIIWMIGIVIASFMFSGSIPMVIYYGLKLLRPQYIYVCSFLVCAILSIVTGTSWGSAATGGVAMMGVAAGFGIPLHITAASVICGALVGDKLSPLSETTNLAPMCCGASIYSHIKSMLWTTLPASFLSILFFGICGKKIFISSNEFPANAIDMMQSLDKIYDWNLLLILPFIILLFGAFLKIPPVLVMIISSAIAFFLGGVIQGFPIVQGIASGVEGFSVSLVYDGEIAEAIGILLNRGGMKSMAGIVIVVYCGYAYAAIIDKAGFLKIATRPMLKHCQTRVALVGSALFINFLIAACAGSSYPAFIITGEMFKEEFEKKGMPASVLSRTLEDSGTMMLPLVPWSAAGAFYVATLGVEVFGRNGYALYSMNTYLNPIMAMILALLGIGMYKKGDNT